MYGFSRQFSKLLHSLENYLKEIIRNDLRGTICVLYRFCASEIMISTQAFEKSSACDLLKSSKGSSKNGTKCLVTH